MKLYSLAVVLAALPCLAADAQKQVQVESGTLEGTLKHDESVRLFAGVPFAAPPVGDLRWKAPQAVVAWTGVRAAHDFGARCVQAPVFKDMVFRDPGMREDCLFLNIWTPAKPGRKPLPVLVYFYGGGFVGGAGDEPRYDGAN